jgi:hypothetical protein
VTHPRFILQIIAITARQARIDALVVALERDSEEPVREEVLNGTRALTRALTILLAHSALHVGDRVTIEAAD